MCRDDSRLTKFSPGEVVDSLIPKDLLHREAMRAHFGEEWTAPKELANFSERRDPVEEPIVEEPIVEEPIVEESIVEDETVGSDRSNGNSSEGLREVAL